MARKQPRKRVQKRDEDRVPVTDETTTSDGSGAADGATIETLVALDETEVQARDAGPQRDPNAGPHDLRPDLSPDVNARLDGFQDLDRTVLDAQMAEHSTQFKDPLGATIARHSGPGVDDMLARAGKAGLGKGGLDDYLPTESKGAAPPAHAPGKDPSLYGGSTWDWIPGVGSTDDAMKGMNPVEKALAEKEKAEKPDAGVPKGEKGPTTKAKDPYEAKLAEKEAKDKADQKAKDEKQAEEKKRFEAAKEKEKAEKEKAEKEKKEKEEAEKKKKEEEAKKKKKKKDDDDDDDYVNPDEPSGTSGVTVTGGSTQPVKDGSWVSKPVNPDVVGGDDGGVPTIDPLQTRGGVNPGVIDKDPDYQEVSVVAGQAPAKSGDWVSKPVNPDDLTPAPGQPGTGPAPRGGDGDPDAHTVSVAAVAGPAPTEVAPRAPAPVVAQDAPQVAVGVDDDFSGPPPGAEGGAGEPGAPADDDGDGVPG